MKRLLKLLAIEVLVYPALLLMLLSLYAIGLPGLEIVAVAAVVAIAGGVVLAIWTLPRKLRVIWGKNIG